MPCPLAAMSRFPSTARKLLDTGLVEYFKVQAGERGYQTLINETTVVHSLPIRRSIGRLADHIFRFAGYYLSWENSSVICSIMTSWVAVFAKEGVFHSHQKR